MSSTGFYMISDIVDTWQRALHLEDMGGVFFLLAVTVLYDKSGIKVFYTKEGKKSRFPHRRVYFRLILSSYQIWYEYLSMLSFQLQLNINRKIPLTSLISCGVGITGYIPVSQSKQDDTQVEMPRKVCE